MRVATVAFLCGVVLLVIGLALHAFNLNYPADTRPDLAPVGSDPSAEHEVQSKVSQPRLAPVVPQSPVVIETTSARREVTPQAQLLRLMKSARYAFNHPSILYLGRRAQITLALAADDKQALETLKGQFGRSVEGEVNTGATVYAPVMVATLRGKAFKVEPSGEQARAVVLSEKGPVEWTWFVEPLEAGEGQLLLLELSARTEGLAGSALVQIKTFRARIDVNVRVWDRLLVEARRMTPISQALTGLGGLVAVIGFIGSAVRWLRPPKAGSTSTPPLPSSQPPPLPSSMRD